MLMRPGSISSTSLPSSGGCGLSQSFSEARSTPSPPPPVRRWGSSSMHASRDKLRGASVGLQHRRASADPAVCGLSRKASPSLDSSRQRPATNTSGQSRSQKLTIMVEEVEEIDDPPTVYYKMLVRYGLGSSHHVSKTYSDLESLSQALSREMPLVRQPRLPKPSSEGDTDLQYREKGFVCMMNAYLTCLSCKRQATESYSFKNFFQLTEDYDSRTPRGSLSSASRSMSTGPFVHGGGSSTAPVGGALQRIERKWSLPGHDHRRFSSPLRRNLPHSFLGQAMTAPASRAPTVPSSLCPTMPNSRCATMPNTVEDLRMTIEASAVQPHSGELLNQPGSSASSICTTPMNQRPSEEEGASISAERMRLLMGQDGSPATDLSDLIKLALNKTWWCAGNRADDPHTPLPTAPQRLDIVQDTHQSTPSAHVSPTTSEAQPAQHASSPTGQLMRRPDVSQVSPQQNPETQPEERTASTVRPLSIRNPETARQEANLPEGAGRESCSWLPKLPGRIEAMIDTLTRPVIEALPAEEEDEPQQFIPPRPRAPLSVPTTQASLSRPAIRPQQTPRAEQQQQQQESGLEQQSSPIQHHLSSPSHPVSRVPSQHGSPRAEAAVSEQSSVTRQAASPPLTLTMLPQDTPTHGPYLQDTLFPEGIPPLPAEYTDTATSVSTAREESSMQAEERQQILRHPTIPESEDESAQTTARGDPSEAPSPTSARIQAPTSARLQSESEAPTSARIQEEGDLSEASPTSARLQDGMFQGPSIISEADSAVTDATELQRRGSGSSHLSAVVSKERRRISGVRRPSILPCAICFENQQEMAIDPCGHISMCHGCSQKVTVCPVCRGPICKALRVFLAGTG